VIPSALLRSLPKAYGDCSCVCHRVPGVYHCAPCCHPKTASGEEAFRRRFHEDGEPADFDDVFVFGSSIDGAHRSESAAAAVKHYGARVGISIGQRGNSYAIPVKDADMKPLPLADIRAHVDDFLRYAASRPRTSFFVTRIGCGLNGREDQQIAALFSQAPENCSFAKEWEPFVSAGHELVVQE
jgi:hypothetical protein